eukprot:jgi/Botrbrau1/9784/Bobra.85_1s0028.1
MFGEENIFHIWLYLFVSIFYSASPDFAKEVPDVFGRLNATVAVKTLGGFYPGVFTDIGLFGRFWESQYFPVTTFDTILPSAILNLSPNSNRYFRIGKCPRPDVFKCLKHGNASNGLPKAVQGVWWQDGVGFDEELISSAGQWFPEIRRLNILAGTESRVWAAHDTVAVKLPGAFWLPSGATHLNWLACYSGMASIVFNEDITFGQIYGSLLLLNTFRIEYPAFYLDWTMSLLPEGSWQRKSRTFGIPTASGDYTLRNVVTGAGQPGTYYKEWTKSRYGRPFIFLDDLI